VNSYYQTKLGRAVKDPQIANDSLEDHNNIMRILYIQAGFKTFRLIMIIFMITYFIGMLYYIFSDLINDIDSPLSNRNGENFIEFFGLEIKSHYEIVVTMVYFTFTSLSTVGFGDLNPRSNSERILTAVILLFGVAIFSYILG
jgi:hypothetical protein